MTPAHKDKNRKRRDGILVRTSRPEDFPGIISVCNAVYPFHPPYSEEQLAAQVAVFPDGQFVAVDTATGTIAGMAASLVVMWDDYESQDTWKDFTEGGTFANHDAQGRTLYAAEVMVQPRWQGCGVGKKLYQSRRDLTRRLGLLRIRAGARLRGFSAHAHRFGAQEYVERVCRGEIWDPTVSFQIRQGFRVIGVVPGYLKDDPESLGYAAIIEWRNPDLVGKRHGAAAPSPEPPERQDP